MQFSDQKKGMLMAFTAVMFITPDSLFIRLANINSWNLIFYRGFIPFSLVFIGLLLIYKNDSKENYLIVCKNQTCSNKIKTIEELKSVIKNYAI